MCWYKMSINENPYTQNWAYYQLLLLIPQAAIYESAGLALPLKEQNSF